MKFDAERNAEADKKRKAEVEKLNEADALIFQTEKNLKDHGDKLTEANRTALQNNLEILRSAHQAKDISRIEGAIEALNEVWQKAAADIYSNPGNAQANAGTTNGTAPGTDPEVVDVEYEDVNDTKR
jgi:molecular chaperone DnaK